MEDRTYDECRPSNHCDISRVTPVSSFSPARLRARDLPAAGESTIESVQCPESALVRCERCHVVRDSKRIACYALWKTRRLALAANVRLSVHFVQIEADFKI